eukprot:TRINITY_DN16031_c0_g2_i1.p1 TRINITY_DN16031_c0_g2~~TRINITY_DN16031_c0_g2_i1.p1  ORF type:complete len:137 (+),score=8.72 TRINITY_DN16031_c0_g2_i1:53-463(+)
MSPGHNGVSEVHCTKEAQSECLHSLRKTNGQNATADKQCLSQGCNFWAEPRFQTDEKLPTELAQNFHKCSMTIRINLADVALLSCRCRSDLHSLAALLLGRAESVVGIRAQLHACSVAAAELVAYLSIIALFVCAA